MLLIKMKIPLGADLSAPHATMVLALLIPSLLQFSTASSAGAEQLGNFWPIVAPPKQSFEVSASNAAVRVQMKTTPADRCTCSNVTTATMRTVNTIIRG